MPGDAPAAVAAAVAAATAVARVTRPDYNRRASHFRATTISWAEVPCDKLRAHGATASDIVDSAAIPAEMG